MIDPQLVALFEQSAPLPPVTEVGPVAARRNMEEMTSGWPREPIASVTDIELDGDGRSLPGRVYRPAAAITGTMLFLHGGGWVIGGIETHDGMCRAIANRSSVTVLSVGYRLAPEAPFPAAVDDALFAARWAHDHIAALGGGPLVMGGDSAGATLTAVTCLAARRSGPSIRAQVLIYPATDLRMGSASYDECGDDYILNRAEVGWYLDRYAPPDVSDWRVSPLLADDVGGVPPALVITAEHDPLRDEGEAYGARLAAAGVAVEVERYDGMVHAFAMFPGIDAAGRAIDQIAAFVGRHLAGPGWWLHQQRPTGPLVAKRSSSAGQRSAVSSRATSSRNLRSSSPS